MAHTLYWFKCRTPLGNAGGVTGDVPRSVSKRSDSSDTGGQVMTVRDDYGSTSQISTSLLLHRIGLSEYVHGG